MIARFHRDRSGARWIAILLLVTGWLSPALYPHASEDDRLCAVPGAGGSGSIARLGVDRDVSPPDHCAICHAARSLRAAGTAGARAAVALVPQPNVEPPVDLDHRAPASDRLPARAPPVEA